jgi:hypothetical protein
VGAYLKGVSPEELNEFQERFPIRERQVDAPAGDSEIEAAGPSEEDEALGDEATAMSEDATPDLPREPESSDATGQAEGGDAEPEKMEP